MQDASHKSYDHTGGETRESLVKPALFLSPSEIIMRMHPHSLCGGTVTMHEVTQVVCGAITHKLIKTTIRYLATGYL